MTPVEPSRGCRMRILLFAAATAYSFSSCRQAGGKSFLRTPKGNCCTKAGGRFLFFFVCQTFCHYTIFGHLLPMLTLRMLYANSKYILAKFAFFLLHLAIWLTFGRNCSIFSALFLLQNYFQKAAIYKNPTFASFYFFQFFYIHCRCSFDPLASSTGFQLLLLCLLCTLPIKTPQLTTLSHKAQTKTFLSRPRTSQRQAPQFFGQREKIYFYSPELIPTMMYGVIAGRRTFQIIPVVFWRKEIRQFAFWYEDWFLFICGVSGRYSGRKLLRGDGTIFAIIWCWTKILKSWKRIFWP